MRAEILEAEREAELATREGVVFTASGAGSRQENLRILYLTANPSVNLHTESEVRGVQEAIRRTTNRTAVNIDFRPAATADDLQAGLNELRPQVVHFSGHAGDAALLFEPIVGAILAPERLPYELLARVLLATDSPPCCNRIKRVQHSPWRGSLVGCSRSRHRDSGRSD